jgi:hypothetical protein
VGSRVRAKVRDAVKLEELKKKKKEEKKEER